jgi:hypothetical protein
VCLIDSTSNAELLILCNDYNVFYDVGMHCNNCILSCFGIHCRL